MRMNGERIYTTEYTREAYVDVSAADEDNLRRRAVRHAVGISLSALQLKELGIVRELFIRTGMLSIDSLKFPFSITLGPCPLIQELYGDPESGRCSYLELTSYIRRAVITYKGKTNN